MTGASNPLGEFLRARRARVSPADVGLRTLGTRRTVGLRREEVAALAGISVEYLVRLERGRDRNPSPAVQRALALALRLPDDAAAHLAALVDNAEPMVDQVAVTEPPEAIISLIDRLDTPAIVTNRYLDLVTTNAIGAELHRSIGLVDGCNMAREFFLNPRSREIYVNWDRIAAETAGNLRSLSQGSVTDSRLIGLVGELSVASAEFAHLWARAEVAAKTEGIKRLRHPDYGEIDMMWSTLEIAAAPGLLVVAYQPTADDQSIAAFHAMARRGGSTYSTGHSS